MELSVENVVKDVVKEAISSGMFKQATKWDDLSVEQQKQYLKQHPKSKRHITAKPKLKTNKDIISKFKDNPYSLGANNISIDDEDATLSFETRYDKDQSKKKLKELGISRIQQSKGLKGEMYLYKLIIPFN